MRGLYLLRARFQSQHAVLRLFLLLCTLHAFVFAVLEEVHRHRYSRHLLVQAMSGLQRQVLVRPLDASEQQMVMVAFRQRIAECIVSRDTLKVRKRAMKKALSSRQMSPTTPSLRQLSWILTLLQ